MLQLISLIIVLMLLVLVCLVFISTLFSVASVIKGAPFVRTNPERLQKMLDLAQVEAGEKAVDLGSGDGTLMIALAKKGAIADGYEINPFLVWWSHYRIRRAGATNQAKVYWSSFWSIDLSRYDLVVVYGITRIMADLGKKLQRELKPGARVVSNAFKFPHWEPEQQDGVISLYITRAGDSERSKVR